MSSLLKFFCLTYLLSWASFITAGAIATNSSHGAVIAVRGTFLLVGTFAPALLALALTARVEGRAGVRELLRGIVHWRVGAGWYLFAVTYMAVIKLAVALVYRLVSPGWPRFGHEAWYIILMAILLATPVQAGEEIGWRGYALPRLSERLGLPRASIVLGAVWACWHLPFFFVSGADKSGQSFPVYLLQVTALSVAAAWLYWRTNRSLLLVMLMHSSVNQTIGLVPSTVPSGPNPFAITTSLVAWLTVGLLFIPCIYFLFQMRSRRLQTAWPGATEVLECQRHEPSAAPNGGPARRLGSSAVGGGPPSVS
jgi:membrane protease YdiL (CAAX protease family)